MLGLLALLVLFLMLLAAFSNRLHRSLRQATASTVALAYQASHDPLTGLANRRAVLACTQALLVGPLASRAGAAVLYIDVDEFKRINDTLGHLAGDVLLGRIAQRIAAATPAATAAHPGGDEFVVVVAGPVDDGAAERTAQTITDALVIPFSLHGRTIRVTASIGIARLEDAVTAEEVFARADAAMYTAKRAGKGLSAVFDPAMFALLQARLELESELRLALETRTSFASNTSRSSSRRGAHRRPGGARALGPPVRPQRRPGRVHPGRRRVRPHRAARPVRPPAGPRGPPDDRGRARRDAPPDDERQPVDPRS